MYVCMGMGIKVWYVHLLIVIGIASDNLIPNIHRPIGIFDGRYIPLEVRGCSHVFFP